MQYDLVAIVWPDPKTYVRFREVCGDDVPDTYLEFLQMVAPRVREAEDLGKRVEKVVVDPDEMERWCLAHHGKVETEQRSLFALFKVRSKYGKGADAIN